MANGITDLGNNLGYIYAVEAGDITKFVSSERNTPTGVRNMKMLATQAVALSLNKRAYGIISVSAVTGGGDVTAINIDGVNQIDVNVSYVAGPTADVATAIAGGINSFTPGSGYDYIAVAISNKVYVYAPIEAGSDPNGKAITVSNTGNLTTVQTDITHGSANTTIYDTETGLRFYINANYNSADAEPGTLTNAIEISNAIIPRGLNESFDRQSATIASGVITLTRKAAITVLDADTQASAASDDLDSIIFGEAADGDIIWLRGANSSRIVSITTAGNISRVNAFSTADKSTQIGLMFFGGTLYEFARSGGNYVPTAAAFRTASFPLLTSTAYGRTTVAPANNTTTTITPNSSKNTQLISGSVTLSTGNYVVDIVTTGAIAGDEFYIAYYGTVTVGAFAVVIEGNTLTTNEALKGGVIIHFIYDAGWQLIGRYYDLSVYDLESDNIGAGQITTAKLATANQYEFITFPVSFETGEQCNNRIKVPFGCTLESYYGIVTKAIAATDAGTIVAKNGAGTTMADGTMTFAASDALNTAYEAIPSTNNTIAADDIIYFTTAKTTAGGKVLVTAKFLRA